MSVVFFGVSVAQVVEPALFGLILLLLGVLLTGVSRRSAHGFTLEPNPLSARWFEVLERLMSISSTPSTPRAPPKIRFGKLQPIPISTEVYRRRRISRLNELS